MSDNSIKTFIINKDWDVPFFKQLAHNDTGSARGHQGGVVLPKDLRRFLPTLDESSTSPESPTTDRHLNVEMFVGAVPLAEGTIRYQFQTWGGKRSPESRLTDGIKPLRDLAREGDMLLFQRRANALDQFRFILIKRESADFAEIDAMCSGRPWGPLDADRFPVDQAQLKGVDNEIAKLSEEPFALFRPQVERTESWQSRIARSSIFRERVRREYGYHCAVSRVAIATPRKLFEVEAAHVVPISEGGSDDVRNGLALTQTVHWAFDRFLFGILPDRTIYVPNQVRSMPQNEFLCRFHGKQLAEAKSKNLRVHPQAVEWHLQNVVKRWE